MSLALTCNKPARLRPLKRVQKIWQFGGHTGGHNATNTDTHEQTNTLAAAVAATNTKCQTQTKRTNTKHREIEASRTRC